MPGTGLEGYLAILPALNQNLPVPGSVVRYQTYLLPRALNEVQSS